MPERTQALVWRGAVSDMARVWRTAATIARRVPSPRLRGEGWGEGQPQTVSLEYGAASHPDPLPAPLELAGRLELRGERESACASNTTVPCSPIVCAMQRFMPRCGG